MLGVILLKTMHQPLIYKNVFMKKSRQIINLMLNFHNVKRTDANITSTLLLII